MRAEIPEDEPWNTPGRPFARVDDITEIIPESFVNRASERQD